MSITVSDWAENECRIACKRENPDFNFDDKDAWDYGCSCYKSALKAYRSLMEDGHSGMSFSFTKNILIRLMNEQPLTPITDEDFFTVEHGTEDWPGEPDEWLKEQGLKSDLQCPRMFSLFRKEHLDGTVTYHDNNRCYFIDIDNPSWTYHSNSDFLDKMFPIIMPYYPNEKPYKIYTQEILTDKKNGDFDTKAILYMISPEGEKIDLNIFEAEINGHWVNISKEEYIKRFKNRIDESPKHEIVK